VRHLVSDIERLATRNASRIVVATRDADGVPNVSPEFLFHWGEDRIYFAKFPGSETLDNLRRAPEITVSLVDWVGREGLQLKGRARPVDLGAVAVARPTIRDWLVGLGCNQVIEVEVHEVFDAKPGDDRRGPLWTSGVAWVSGAKPAPFRRPEVQPLPMDAALLRQMQAVVRYNLDARVPSFLATVDDRGVPNLSPRFVLEADSDFLLYGDAFKNKSFLNLARPSPVSLALINWDKRFGYQVRGWSDPQYRGEWILRVQEHWQRIGFKNGLVQAVLIRPEEVFQVEIGPRRRVFTGNERAAWLPGAKGEAA
jgi:predicted pyridoxine 5'-phosphate oxidase superfamily flavin-nucleotide-binding protein